MKAPAVGDAAELLRTRLGAGPRTMIVAGSGLGALAEAVERPVIVPFEEVPGLPAAGVAGHAGRFVGGILEGRPVLVQAGRIHVYEGHPLEVVTAPARIGAALGVRELLLTNAAGGVDRRLAPGDLMLIDDHVDLTWRSPLAGPVRPGEERFPDMSAPYDPALQRLALAVAAEAGIRLVRGTYAAVAGPSYETPAEIRMLADFGADAVGMSTVPEVVVARAAGVRVLAVSLITNRAAGMGPERLSHAEVMEVGRRAGSLVVTLLRGVVRKLAAEEAGREDARPASSPDPEDVGDPEDQRTGREGSTK